MKKLLSLLLCALLLSGCAATYDGPTETELVPMEYEIRHYSPFFDDTDAEIIRIVYAYDIYGNLAASQEYDDGELCRVTYYRYDDRGNQISETCWDHTGLIPLPESRLEITYDGQNRPLSTIYKNGWGVEENRSTYTYDDVDHTMTWRNSSGDEVIYYCDENGLTLRDVSTGAAGTFETVYEYDAQGNQISWSTTTENGEFWGCWKAGYDDQGRQILFEFYNETNTRTTHITYTYDDEAHTQTTHKTDGDIRIEYYDADGRIHLIEDYSENGELTMYQQYFYQEIRVPVTREE